MLSDVGRHGITHAHAEGFYYRLAGAVGIDEHAVERHAQHRMRVLPGELGDDLFRGDIRAVDVDEAELGDAHRAQGVRPNSSDELDHLRRPALLPCRARRPISSGQRSPIFIPNASISGWLAALA